MRTFLKSFLLILLFGVAFSATGCKVFKKDCDCPSFKNKKAEQQQMQQDFAEHAPLNVDSAVQE